jgi:hypothetical protein
LAATLPQPLLSLVHTHDESLDADLYACSHGPDELVGLRVWHLGDITDTGSAQWFVDMAQYDEEQSEEELLQLELLRMTRSSARRKVSAGLIALVLGCESLMTGMKRFASEEQLVAAWQRALFIFDEMASQLSEEHAEKLFDEVWVCGNGHAVCKKLENLVKSQVFAFENSLTCFSDAALVAVMSPTERSGVWEVSRTDGSATTPGTESHSLGGERFAQGLAWPEDEQEHEEMEQEDAAAAFAQQRHLSPRPLPPAALPIDHRRPYEDDGPLEDDNDEEDEDEDDDGSIVPEYRSSEVGYAGASVAQALALAPQPPPQPSLTAPVRLNPSQGQEQGRVQVAWKSLFPHFGAVFPVTNGAAAALQTNGLPTPHAFKAAMSCVEVQAKMYDEWLEVMSDYSTALVPSSSMRGRGQGGPVSEAEAEAEAQTASNPSALLYRVNSSRPEVYNIVTDALHKEECFSQWRELPAGLGLGATWNLLWTWSKPKLNMQHLLVWQRINHFQDSKQLTRKDLLKKNLQRYTELGAPGATGSGGRRQDRGSAGNAFEIMPQTFLLPHEYIHFVQAFQETEATREADGAQNYWIMKPVGMSRGRGISLVRDVASLAYSQTSVIQRYVERPMCLDGYKFDLRLYVLVTSFRPLEAFIYSEGFARVSTQRYSLDGADMANKFIHLTNSSIQKQNAAGPSRDNPLRNNAHGGGDGGSKLTLQGPDGLWARLRAVGIDSDLLWRNIQLCVLKSLVVVDDKMTHQPCSFELFGYDVLIDQDQRPWLIEVNASPSLARENATDHSIKNAMIRDTIALVDPPAFDRAALAKVLRRRAAEFARLGEKLNVKRDAELQADLDAILGASGPPRAYGEEPRHPGAYQRLCPNTKIHEHVIKMKRRLFKEK